MDDSTPPPLDVVDFLPPATSSSSTAAPSRAPSPRGRQKIDVYDDGSFTPS